MKKYWLLKGFNDNMDSLKREALNGHIHISHYRREYMNINDLIGLRKHNAKQVQIFHAFARIYFTK